MGRTPAGQTRERVLRFVRRRLLAGRPPTIRDVQAAFAFRAVQTAREHLEKLVDEGKLTKEEGQARGYRLAAAHGGMPRPAAWVPLLGRVQAGSLSAAIEEPDGYLSVELSRAADDGKLFALRVRGESMTGAGIFDGDIVVVRKQATARTGEVVVALVENVEDEATVKRLRLRGRRIELHPENPAFETIVPPADRVRILGKVIEIRRRLE